MTTQELSQGIPVIGQAVLLDRLGPCLVTQRHRLADGSYHYLVVAGFDDIPFSVDEVHGIRRHRPTMAK
jgi:hypothetical protein